MNKKMTANFKAIFNYTSIQYHGGIYCICESTLLTI